MPSSEVVSFTDPHCYQAAILGGQAEIYPTTGGVFYAELTNVNLRRLWMQHGRESLPRIRLGKIDSDCAPISFLLDDNQPKIRYCGIDVSPGEIIVNSSDVMHCWTEAPCRWASMSVTPKVLATAGRAIVGRELTVPRAARVKRPSPPLMSRLLNLHRQVGHLARAAPEKLSRAPVARALEQALVHAMIACLTEDTPTELCADDHHHSAVIARLGEFLEANHDRPVYLAELCVATGVSERTLRFCCQEHLGVAPIRYLWLRRMHLARRALVTADTTAASVTEIATDHGFWELGRFSVEYGALFGEPPSVTLRRPAAGERHIYQDRPFSLPAAEFA